MLNWANRFNICCFLDDHDYRQRGNRFDCILAADSLENLRLPSGRAFQELERFHKKHADWLFGHLSFELKTETEGVTSKEHNHAGFPDLHFFLPRYTIQLSDSTLIVGSLADDHELVLNAIVECVTIDDPMQRIAPAVIGRQTKDDYIKAVIALKQHILRGDCYELNYCQEFFSESCSIQPFQLFTALQAVSPAPFSAYYRLNELYCLSASPERYLQKKGSKIMSQPIKGTRKRMVSVEDDQQVIDELLKSEKERAENVMVVDLVRNDISKICREGTVNVDELFAVYSFPQVHQMISTVSGELADNHSWCDAIAATFPMGSMTGAPKRRVLELIDRYEASARGLYSGAIGYITPEGDFDFNVVIRSVMYNSDTRFLNFHAGSAITFQSDPELEYEECLLKAAFIRQVLEAGSA
ncbi:MAG TPA: anthranilate synthase component I family protein [Flavitalea sp.]|nr:anthranilate synthase component I family protein [Flavitalea sp.]